MKYTNKNNKSIWVIKNKIYNTELEYEWALYKMELFKPQKEQHDTTLTFIQILYYLIHNRFNN